MKHLTLVEFGTQCVCECHVSIVEQDSKGGMFDNVEVRKFNSVNEMFTYVLNIDKNLGKRKVQWFSFNKNADLLSIKLKGN